ncbi:MAG: hypothetical protein H6835_06870 [Planctomycetes bacterium]|nr:hypothetical protein [Planctomycetota bacterium]
MPWLLLVLGGLFETCWSVGLAYTDGFRRPWPTAFVAVALLASMWLLAVAQRGIPIGTAYAVWVGIGALGTAIYGVLKLGESASPLRLLFLGLLLVAIVGLKLTDR